MRCRSRGFLQPWKGKLGGAGAECKTGREEPHSWFLVLCSWYLALPMSPTTFAARFMNESPLTNPPASRWTWFGVAAMVLVVLGVPTLLAFGPSPRRQFDDKLLKQISKEKPASVLIGDSMLETRIDGKT